MNKEQFLLFKEGGSKARLSPLKVGLVKGIIEAFEKILYKVLKIKDMEYDLKNYGNKNANIILAKLKETAEKVRNEYAKRRFYELGVLTLWISNFDFAYKDMFYDFVNSIGKLEQKEIIKDPDEWHLHKVLKRNGV